MARIAPRGMVVRTKSVLRAALLLIALAGAALLLPGSGEGAFPGTNGRIVFESPGSEGEADGIYSVNPDGTGERTLIEDLSGEQAPAVSADGRRIVFQATPFDSGATEVYVMNADGSDVTRLTHDGGFAGDPAFSPDGQEIVFERGPDRFATNLWLMNADGSNEGARTSGDEVASDPAWSPDGSRIAFAEAASLSDNPNIRTIASDGSDPQTLTSGPEAKRSPDWSPDGGTIAFESREDSSEVGSGLRQIFTVPAGGGVQAQLTDSDSDESMHPSYSPDGTRMAVEGTFPGDIYTMAATGGPQTQVAIAKSQPRAPAWGTSAGPAPAPRADLEEGGAASQRTVGQEYERTLLLRNRGNADLVVSGVSLSGSDRLRITIENCSGRTLAPGASCQIAVRGDTSQVGDFTATITVASNDPRGDVSTQLRLLVVSGELPVNTGRPTLTGTPKVGETLGCTTGTWNANPTSFTYVWQRALPGTPDTVGDDGWRAIDGAVGQTYVVQAADGGFLVRCFVVARNASGTGEAASLSKQVDLGVPEGPAPVIAGLPQVARELSCEPGVWKNNPRFEFRWLRGEIGVGSGQKYTPTTADAGGQLTCEVVGRNDVGASAPLRSAAVRVLTDRPRNLTPPTLRTAEVTGPRPTDRRYTCLPGTWTDDEGSYEFEIRRGDAVVATTSTYTITPDDFGRELKCIVRARNAVGLSDPASSEPRLVPLPEAAAVTLGPPPPGGTVSVTTRNTARILFAGSRNAADPINMLAVPEDFVAAIDAQTGARVRAEFEVFKDRCRAQGLSRPLSTPAHLIVNDALRARETCRLAVTTPPQNMRVAADGVRIAPPGARCIAGPFNPCQTLPVNLRALRPSSALSLLRRAATSASVPKRIIWDVNSDGRVDASCGGDAPVLRTLPQPGVYNVRAILVMPDSEARGFYPSVSQTVYVHPSGTQIVDANKNKFIVPELIPRIDDIGVNPLRDISIFNNPGQFLGVGALRPQLALAGPSFTNPAINFQVPNLQRFGFERSQESASATATAGAPSTQQLAQGNVRGRQLFGCRTSLQPPPDPDLGPVVNEAWIGKVHVTGSLAPVSMRQIPTSEFNALPDDLKKLLGDKSFQEFAEEQRKAELELGDKAKAAFRRLASTPEGAYTQALGEFATYVTPPAPKVNDAGIKQALEQIPGISTQEAQQKVGFALDQIYVAKDTIKVNGVDLEPDADAVVAMVPSDVGELVPEIRKMEVVSSAVDFAMGKLPLSDGAKELQSRFEDSLKSAANEKLAELQVLSDNLKGRIKEFLGPFTLSGDIDVRMAEGTAILDANAEIPVLKTSPTGGRIGFGITLRGDLEGNVQLDGIRLKYPNNAYLGFVTLSDLDFAYSKATGLDTQGKVRLPWAGNAGIDIVKFALGPKGTLDALNLRLILPPGAGIPLGPSGTFLTAFGGGFESSDITGRQLLEAEATVSVGPSFGGGCSTVSATGKLTAQWKPPPFYIRARVGVEVLCVPLLDVNLYLDANGAVDVNAGFDIDAGPLYVKGRIGGAFNLPNWMVYGDLEGGIRSTPISGELRFRLGNKGVAACASIGPLAAGAGLRFPGGVPPLNLLAAASNLEIFFHCDLRDYESVVPPPGAVRAAQAGNVRTVQVGAGERALALSVEGAGDAPHAVLTGPDGTVLDLANAQQVRTAMAVGARLEREDRAGFVVANPARGTWRVQVAPGSPAILRVRRADAHPPVNVRAGVKRLSGSARGSSARVLRYDVAPIAGQVVRFYEETAQGEHHLLTVKRGGRGSLRFLPSETRSPRRVAPRSVVARVEQDEMTRERLVVARYHARSPRIGRATRVRVRRAGSRGRAATRRIVAWRPAPLAKRYEVTITTEGGRRVMLTPRGKRRRVTVTGLGPREGLRAAVVAISPSEQRGRQVTRRHRVSAPRSAARR